MTLGTKDFMALSHAQCAMKASDMAYRLEAAEKLIEQLCDYLTRIEYLENYNGTIMSAGNCSDVASEALAAAKQFKGEM